MPDETFLLFDFDDTLSDPAALVPQYVGELARLLAKEFGGEAMEWAEEAGAKVVQVCLRPAAPEPEFPLVLTRLADWPGLIGRAMGDRVTG